MPNILVNIEICDGKRHKEVHCAKKNAWLKDVKTKKQVNHPRLMWIVQAYFAGRVEVLAHIYKWFKKKDVGILSTSKIWSLIKFKALIKNDQNKWRKSINTLCSDWGGDHFLSMTFNKSLEVLK